jgi:hypothetical protein
MTTIKGFAMPSLRCQYQAVVMNRFEMMRSRIVGTQAI